MNKLKIDPCLPLLILWAPLFSPVRCVIKADTRYVSNETSLMSQFRSISSLRDVCWLCLWDSRMKNFEGAAPYTNFSSSANSLPFDHRSYKTIPYITVLYKM